MKLMGLNADEMSQALQQAMTSGSGGGLMTAQEAIDAFLVYRTRRFRCFFLTVV